MMISNKTYDILKWVALVAIPAIEAFWLTVGKVWGFPYLTEIGTTIAAVGLLIAALIGVSSNNYYKAHQDAGGIEYEPYDEDEDIEDYEDDDEPDSFDDYDDELYDEEVEEHEH